MEKTARFSRANHDSHPGHQTTLVGGRSCLAFDRPKQCRSLHRGASLPETGENPDQIARDAIDRRLEASGWAVQNNTSTSPLAKAWTSANTPSASDRPPMHCSPDATQQVSWGPNPTVGAKITTVEAQSCGYAGAKLKWVKSAERLPFVYEATGVHRRYTDAGDPKPRSREVFTFYRPETPGEWFEKPSFRSSTPGIATLPGHSLKHVEPILDAHQLKRDSSAGVTAIRKREAHEAGTKSPNRATLLTPSAVLSRWR